MIAPLLLAAVAAISVPHLPVRAARSIAVSREAPQRVEGGSLNLVAYCDARGQSWITVTNAGPTAFDVEWTLIADKPGYPPDQWSSVSRVEPGQFESWMSPAPTLHLDIRYDDDGLPATNSIDASCSGPAALVSGLQE